MTKKTNSQLPTPSSPNDSDVAIRVSGVSKSFKLPHEKSGSIKSALLGWHKRKKGYENQHVLKDISFDIKKGEFFGIVGRNGSGKSTLLKLISQIYTPDKGSITINGKLTPFIELGVGFNPELSGRDNVYLNGALLGFSRPEMEAMYDDIVGFAELERFMDQKLKNYSSGMQVRLAFSIAIRANTDILVLDEVLAVGDEAFQRKCTDYFYEAKKGGKTIVLVTHSMESVRQFCDKAMLINKGSIVAEGNPDKIATQYSKLFIDEYIGQKIKSTEENDNTSEQRKLSDVRLDTLDIVQAHKKTKVVRFREDFSIEVVLASPRQYKDTVLGIHIINQAGQVVVGLSTKSLTMFNIDHITKLHFELNNVLAEGEYYLAIAVEQKKSKKLLIKESELASFVVTGRDKSTESGFGIVYPEIKLSVD